VLPTPDPEQQPAGLEQLAREAADAIIDGSVPPDMGSENIAHYKAFAKSRILSVCQKVQELTRGEFNSWRPEPISGNWIAVQSENPEYPDEWDVKEGGKGGYSVIGNGFVTERQAKEIALRYNLAEQRVQELTRKERVCDLPDSIKEALNSGDGVYRP